MTLLLEIEDLEIAFGKHTAVNKLNLEIHRAETVALVGESGSGKTVSAQSILQLNPLPATKLLGGSIHFEGQDLLRLNEEQMLSVRGQTIAMVFQDPMTALNPIMSIERQLKEAILTHEKLDKKQLQKRCLELLTLVGIKDPEARLKQYPHELSGGLKQRVMIAIALSCRPKLLIADEPTTALDVTIQAQIIHLLKELQQKLKMSILIITHDLGVVAQLAHRVYVMYAGEIVEEGETSTLFKHPAHPYTAALMSALPQNALPESHCLQSIEGTPPDISNFPTGCRFHPRCPYAMKLCKNQAPKFHTAQAPFSNKQKSSCHLHLEHEATQEKRESFYES